MYSMSIVKYHKRQKGANMLNDIKEIKVVTKESKAGKEYSQLVIVFKNGYVYESFLNNEQVFILQSFK